MATKLRSFSTNIITKITVFILLALSLAAMSAGIHYLAYQGFDPEYLLVKEYHDSNTFLYTEVFWAIDDLNSLMANGQQGEEGNGYYYYLKSGDKTFTNCETSDKSFFAGFDQAFFAYENGIWSCGKQSNPGITRYYGILTDNDSTEITAYLAFADAFLQGKQAEWEEKRQAAIPIFIAVASFAVLALVLIIFLAAVTGRRPRDRELHLSGIDNIYSEILAGVLAIIILAWSFIYISLYYDGFPVGYLGVDQLVSLWANVILTVVASILSGLVFLSLVRKAKAKVLFKHSLIYTVCYKIIDFLRSLFDGRKFEKFPLTKSLFYRQLVFITATIVLGMVALLFIVAPPMMIFSVGLEIAVIYWYIKGNNKTFAEINKGFNQSLEEQMKAERMKIALVTNVSHDLKTPLTSIISYVDLLSQEEDLSPVARDYINILREKSDRLKNIVSDLFDLAKSTSGNIALDLETLDLKRLLEQTLADMEDKIKESGFDIRTRLPEQPLNIIADGKKLYRVFQNIIDNALKYSLHGTRIYIDLEEREGKVIATVKNTAGYEMDMDPDEVKQRFNRGDKSRSTEGSGLGLSIAESFTNACGGRFSIAIDGDQFKVTIIF